MTCECGHTPAPDARFCGQCGRKLVLTGPTEPMQAPVPAGSIGAPVVGDATMAGVGIVPAWKVWTGFGVVALVLLAAGVALRVAVVDDEVVAVGPGDEGAPVVIDVGEDGVPDTEDPDQDVDQDTDQDTDQEQGTDPDPDTDQDPDTIQDPDTDPDPDTDQDPDTIQEPDALPRMVRRPRMRTEPDLPPPATPSMTSPPAPWSGGSTDPNQVALRYRADARRRIASQYGGDIQGCFDAGDAHVPGFSGSVAMAFMLLPDGRVASSRITRDTTGIPAVQSCLRQAANGWRLPPPPPRFLELGMNFSR